MIYSPSQRAQHVQTPIIPTIANLIKTHPGTISLGQGVVHYPPPPEAQARAMTVWDHPANHLYGGVHGHPLLLEKIHSKLNNNNDIILSSDREVMVCAGGNMAYIQTLLAIADQGDEIILIAPYYFNHEMAITLCGAIPVIVPGTSDGLVDPDRLKQAITSRTRAITTVSPNNPSGAVYPEDLLRTINALCSRHGIYHIHDEAYEYFTYDGINHFSPGSLEESKPHTISLFSLSKTYGFAGWRIGYMVYPSTLSESLSKVQDTNLICAPVVSQLAAIGAMETEDRYFRPYVTELGQVRHRVMESLNEIKDHCSFSTPQGAFYVMLDIRTNASPLEMATYLIQKHGIAVIPGDAFGLDAGCPLRVAYGALSRDKVEEGMGRLVEGIREHFH